ncbi:hypothetical protein LIER_14541 [Lithospermum erythrorhizon]|uniref:Uncharacterized protein n=1 Tax=Lithospermum erythrorhizon TaxID=34254 RepID=A0AAV3Q152_LITER
MQTREAARLLTPPPLGFENAKVDLLMDVHNLMWDEAIVKELFFPFEAELILAMPFPDSRYAISRMESLMCGVHITSSVHWKGGQASTHLVA